MGKTLSDMVLDFLEFDDEIKVEDEIEWRSDEDEASPDENSMLETRAFWELQHQLLQEALSRRSSTEARIQRDMEEIIRTMQTCGPICKCLKECRRNCLQRNVVDRLRDFGHNSALCKSKWRRSPEIPSGEHSFIDVLAESRNVRNGPIRVMIELNFRSEFEMARASPGYNSLVANLPETFVGKSEKLRGVVKIMCNAAKKCMKDNRMHLAPWRKLKYMQSKWFSGVCERVAPCTLLPAAVNDRPARPRASMLTFDLHCTAVEVL